MISTHKGSAIVFRLGVVTSAWLMLFVWQGLDFTDMGFWLTGYQQLYTYPDAIGFQSSFWLTSFVSHWLALAFGGDILAYKLGYVIVVTASAVIAYLLLQAQLGRSYFLAAMVFLTVVFTRGHYGNWVGYNELTALFYVAGVALLFFGLRDNRQLLVMLAGVVLGANLFIRFPNLLGISLVSAVWLYAWIKKWSLRTSLIWSSCFLGGFVVGVFVIWCLIVFHGQEVVYWQGIHLIFDLSVNSNSHHSGSGLLGLFLNDHVKAFEDAFILLVIGGGIANWASKQSKMLASVLILACTMLLIYITYILGHSRWLIPGICYVVLLLILLQKSRKDPAFALLAFIAGMVLVLAPLGSNNGISNFVFGIWLALPLTLTWLWRGLDRKVLLYFDMTGDDFKSDYQLAIESRGFRVFALILVLTFVIQSLALAWRHTYLDAKNRFEMKHSIAHPRLAGVFTTAERAKVVTELLDAMSYFVKAGDEVLAYNAIPTLHFLTDTRPWLGDPWPDLVDAEKLASWIRLREEAGASLPCIVRAKGSTYTNSWPTDIQPPVSWMHQDKSRRLFSEFEQRNGYIVVWSNDFFEILTRQQ